MRSILSYNWIELFELYLEQEWNVWDMFLGEAAVKLLVKNSFFWDSKSHSLSYRKSDDTIQQSSSSSTWSNNRRFGIHSSLQIRTLFTKFCHVFPSFFCFVLCLKENNKSTFTLFLSVNTVNLLYDYLGQSKSTEGGRFFSYRKLEKIFVFYQQIERHSLYLSMLFDHYSTNAMIIKFR